MEKSFSVRGGDDDDGCGCTTPPWITAGMEFSERLSNAGLSTSLMTYLTKVLHEEMKVAAKNVNYWVSVTMLMPLLGGFLADGYLGRFSTVVFSTGRRLPTESRPVLATATATAQLAPVLNPAHSPRLHEALFFAGIYLVSVGTGGHKPALESFGADQFDETHAAAERVRKMSFFNWWNCALCAGVLLGVTVVVYAQELLAAGATPRSCCPPRSPSSSPAAGPTATGCPRAARSRRCSRSSSPPSGRGGSRCRPTPPSCTRSTRRRVARRGCFATPTS